MRAEVGQPRHLGAPGHADSIPVGCRLPPFLHIHPRRPGEGSCSPAPPETVAFQLQVRLHVLSSGSLILARSPPPTSTHR